MTYLLSFFTELSDLHITQNDLHKMAKLKRCVLETIRLRGAGVIPRKVTRSFTVRVRPRVIAINSVFKLVTLLGKQKTVFLNIRFLSMCRLLLKWLIGSNSL